MDIPEAIRKMVGENRNLKAILCEVITVTGATCLCRPVDGSADIEDVRLQAEATNEGMLITPVEGSVVIVQMINDVEGYVSMFSEIDNIKFFDGAQGSLVLINSLVTKLNNLENKVNDIITAYNTHVHTGVTTGAGSSAVTPTQVSGTLTPTVAADIDNEKITQ